MAERIAVIAHSPERVREISLLLEDAGETVPVGPGNARAGSLPPCDVAVMDTRGLGDDWSPVLVDLERQGVPALVIADRQGGARWLLALENGVVADLVWSDAVEAELVARLSARLRDVLESRNRAARARCVRLAAHDINSPLTVIGVLADLLKDELSGEALTDLKSMVESADLVSMVVESMNNMARVESPDTDTSSGTVVDMAEIARRIMARPAFRTHVRGSLSQEMPVLADAGALERAFIDLFVNAKSLTDPKSVVLVHGESSGRYHAIVFQTQGPGIPVDLRPRAFELFGSAELRAQRVPIAAVGLAYVARVAKGHGGNVVFADTPEGMSLRFELPVAPR